MLDDLCRRFVHYFLIVWYRPTKKSCYYEIAYHRPRWEVGQENGYSHKVIAIIDLSSIFFKERFRFRRKIYRKFYHFFDKRLNKLNEREKNLNNRYIDHT